MVGVGFGREGDRQSRGTPDKNPLLRATRRSGTPERLRARAEGVHVGLTERTRAATSLRQAHAAARSPDWSAVRRASLSKGQAPPACGKMLVDTGVAAMFMTASPHRPAP